MKSAFIFGLVMLAFSMNSFSQTAVRGYSCAASVVEELSSTSKFGFYRSKLEKLRYKLESELDPDQLRESAAYKKVNRELNTVYDALEVLAKATCTAKN